MEKEKKSLWKRSRTYISDCFDALNDKWFDFTERHKWADWIDDNIIYYVIYKPHHMYRNIKHWFHCNWNRQHFNLVKTSIKAYPWDEGFFYDLHEKWIDKAIRYFEAHRGRMDEAREDMVLRSLKWAKHMVHVMNDSGSELFEYNGGVVFDPVGEPDESGKYKYFEMRKGTLEYVYLGPKMNYSNVKKYYPEFTEESHFKYVKEHPSDYYVRKATRLYFRILEQYSPYWWD